MKPHFTALVVDDDGFSRRTAARILSRLGASSVLEAGDGEEALACLNALEAPVDVLLCDLKMPKVDGIETIQALTGRKRPGLIILVSASDQRILRSAREMSAGFGLAAVRTIGKPLTLRNLQSVLSDALADALADGSGGGPSPQRQQAPGRASSVREVWQAFEDGEFVAHFQPKVDLATRRVIGAEALARWVRPGQGAVPPALFLPAIQEAGLLDRLTFRMLAQAASACSMWRQAGNEVTVSVNLSPMSLASRELPNRLAEIVAGEGLAAEHLVFEVTEDASLRHDNARGVLTRLRLKGFGLSVDDFGTGYSNLQQLLEAPFNELKIDQSFVRAAPGDREAEAALASTILLATRLGLQVVGEGVETSEHWSFLAESGCGAGQGYLIARPMSGSRFLDWALDWALDGAVGREAPSFQRPAPAIQQAARP